MTSSLEQNDLNVRGWQEMGKAKLASVQPTIAVSVLVVWRVRAHQVGINAAAMGVNANVPEAFPSPSRSCTSNTVDKLQ